MKKKFLGVAFVCLSLVSFNSVAQNMCDQPQCQNQENCKPAKDNKKHIARVNPFEGLSLTDSQKSQLKQLRETRSAAHKEQAKVNRNQKHHNDSIRFADRKAAKKQYLEEVKAIVGPDNYVIFLENLVVNGNPSPGKNMMRHKSDFKRDHARRDKNSPKAYKGKNSNQCESQAACSAKS